jgi:5-hydroxyisourate hydrolase
MSLVTTHVLDTARGCPASGVRIALDAWQGDDWQPIAAADTDADGRVRTLLDGTTPLAPGVYRLTFETAPYFAARNITAFYPYVVVVFRTEPGHAHYHVPLLISPFGYTTYRGS